MRNPGGPPRHSRGHGNRGAGGGDRDTDAGLSRADVAEIVRAELANAPEPEPGLTRAEADQIIQAAIAAIPEPEPGLTSAEVEQVVQVAIAAIPEPEPGLTSAEVEQVAQAAIAAMPQPEPGLTRAEAEQIARAAIAGIPEPGPGLTRMEVQRIARGVVGSIPPKSASAEYTKFFVDNAIAMYESEGLDATLKYYNRADSVDGQWYVFIVDENDEVIGHHNAHLIGLDLKGSLGTDAEGYNFGLDMLAATEDGK